MQCLFAKKNKNKIIGVAKPTSRFLHDLGEANDV